MRRLMKGRACPAAAPRSLSFAHFLYATASAWARPATARPSASTPPTARPACRAAAYAREADPGSTILEMNGFSTPRTTPSLQRRPMTVLNGDGERGWRWRGVRGRGREMRTEGAGREKAIGAPRAAEQRKRRGRGRRSYWGPCQVMAHISGAVLGAQARTCAAPPGRRDARCKDIASKKNTRSRSSLPLHINSPAVVDRLLRVLGLENAAVRGEGADGEVVL